MPVSGSSSGLVSVITPVFNRRDIILECVESVRAQTHTSVEHIITDDGSTDGTADHVEQSCAAMLSSGRLKLVRQANGGPASARNAGLSVSCGEFITYLDSDDLYFENHISSLLRPMMENPRVGVTYGGYTEATYDADGHELSRHTDMIDGYKVSELRLKNRIPVMFMHRRSLIGGDGTFNVELTGFEDWDLLIRLTEKSLLRHVYEVTSLRRRFSSRHFFTDEFSGVNRQKIYDRVMRQTMQRELAGPFANEELNREMAAFNEVMLGPIADAAARRSVSDDAGCIREIRFQGTTAELLLIIAEFHTTSAQGSRLVVTLPHDDTPAVEWVGKVNRVLEGKGQAPVRVRFSPR